MAYRKRTPRVGGPKPKDKPLKKKTPRRVPNKNKARKKTGTTAV